MGTTFLHRDKGTTNVDFFFKDEAHFTVHAHATVGGVFYAAVEDDREPGRVWAFLALTHWVPKDYYNFGYKDMSESAGPYYFEAPAAVLDALTPTDNATALWWRDRCRTRVAQRAALHGLAVGDEIELAHPLRFTNGAELCTFTVRRRRVQGNRTTVVLTHDDRGYRVPNWRDQVIAVTRNGVRTDTPLATTRPEREYAAAVKAVSRTEPEVVMARYGTGRYDSAAVEWAALNEYRRGERWERVTETVPA